MAVPTVHLRGLEALTVAPPPRWLRVLQIPLGVSKYMDTLSRSSKYEHAVASHPGKRRQVLLCGYVKVRKVHLDLDMNFYLRRVGGCHGELPCIHTHSGHHIPPACVFAVCVGVCVRRSCPRPQSQHSTSILEQSLNLLLHILVHAL